MPSNPDHFKHIFYFVCSVVGLVIIYIFCVSFFHVPKDNIRFADTALAYLLGLASAAAAYLTGSGPREKKENTSTSSVNIDQAGTVNNSSSTKPEIL